MRTVFMQGVQFFFLMAALVACNAKDPDPAAGVIDIEKIKKEIQAKENEFAETYNSGQMKNIGYYAEDAISFSQNNPPLVGRAAIIEFLAANVDSISKGNKISFTTNEVFVSNDANQVLEIGYYRVVDVDSQVVNSGNYMSLFVKRDGRYVSLRDMSASDMPTP